jgi:L-alanine-DL-glutamate epimerase-like enolase superfamily enzyme
MFFSAYFWLLAEIKDVSMAEVLPIVSSYLLPTKIPVNCLITAESLSKLEESIKRYLKEGFTTFKLKINKNWSENLAKIVLFRSLAPEATLRLDANENLEEHDCLEKLRSISHLKIDYIEQPLPISRNRQLFDLSFESPIRFAFDESAVDISTIKEIVEKSRDPVIILKPARLGGPDKVTEAIYWLNSRQVNTVVTNSLESNIGVRVALECARLLKKPILPCGLATLSLFERALIESDIEKGYFIVPPKMLGGELTKVINKVENKL